MNIKGIENLMKESRTYVPADHLGEGAYIRTEDEYARLYAESINDMEGFWGRMADEVLTWERKWDNVLEWDFAKPSVRWFLNGRLNVSANCIDRHVDSWRRNKAAIIWEGDDGSTKTFTYQQLSREVNRFANVLKKNGVGKGDRVAIYLPMIPELPISLLACARIGAVHSVVFGGFSANALRDRIEDCLPKLVVTSDGGFRGGRRVPVKFNCDAALSGGCQSVQRVIVVKRTGEDVPMMEGRDSWWHEELSADDILSYCTPEVLDSEDPLFILYTSGSTGKPKGVIHSSAGYLLYTALTFKWIFNYKEEDIFFCTADIGWITGHSYIVYGPLACGATSLMFEGTPMYPAPDRFWDIIEKHHVNIFYTAPTVIRALMREGDRWVRMHNMESLKLLGTVGEPINPEAWVWYQTEVGKGRLPVLDTWWQTETGGILISPLPGVTTLKPGAATKPFFGVSPRILKEDASEAGVNEGGYLVIDKPWPAMLRGTFGDSENVRLKEQYFSRFPGFYFSGDGARFDGDGDYWLMGRIDDVLNVSGHRLGTAEIESALVSHGIVAEAAVVGFPHDIKGDGVYAFVALKEGNKGSDSLALELKGHVAKEISPIAKPDKIQFVDGLPKTRSGKIMRRILRKVAAGRVEDLGDISTLSNPSIVDGLVNGGI